MLLRLTINKGTTKEEKFVCQSCCDKYKKETDANNQQPTQEPIRDDNGEREREREREREEFPDDIPINKSIKTEITNLDKEITNYQQEFSQLDNLDEQQTKSNKQLLQTQIDSLNDLITKLQELVKQFENIIQKINNVSQLTKSQKQQITSNIDTPLQQLLVNCQKKQSRLNSLLNSQENNSPKPTNWIPWVIGSISLALVFGLIIYFTSRKRKKNE